MKNGSIHIGDSVYVKWYLFQGKPYIVIRKYKEDGTADRLKGINLLIQYLPKLKMAIDKAYERYKKH